MDEPLLPCPRGCVEPPTSAPNESRGDPPWVACGNDDCSFSARLDDWNRRGLSLIARTDLELVADECEKIRFNNDYVPTISHGKMAEIIRDVLESTKGD